MQKITKKLHRNHGIFNFNYQFFQKTWVAQKAYIACKHAPLTNIQQNPKKNYTIQEQAISTQKIHLTGKEK